MALIFVTREIDRFKQMYHIVAASISFIGCLGSFMTLLSEFFRWKSYGKFSIATKIPVQFFGIKGPLALIALMLYLILSILLATETGTSTVFYICCSWAVLYFDLAIEFYESTKEAFAHSIDRVVHATNSILLFYSFIKLSFIPVTFLLLGSLFWGILVLKRVRKRREINQTD